MTRKDIELASDYSDDYYSYSDSNNDYNRKNNKSSSRVQPVYQSMYPPQSETHDHYKHHKGHHKRHHEKGNNYNQQQMYQQPPPMYQQPPQMYQQPPQMYQQPPQMYQQPPQMYQQPPQMYQQPPQINMPPQSGPNSYTPSGGYSAESILNVQYVYVTVDQWNSIANEKTEFSHLWDKDQFTPDKFAKNLESSNKCLNPICAALFLFCLVSWIALIIVAAKNSLIVKVVDMVNGPSNTMQMAIYKMKKEYLGATRSTLESFDYEKLEDELFGATFITLGICLAWSVFHLLYVNFLPEFYVKFGLLAGAILSMIALISIGFIFNSSAAFITIGVIIAVLVLIIILCYRCFYEQIEFTWQCMSYTMHIIRNHLTIFIIVLFMVCINLCVYIAFGCSIIFIFTSSISPGWMAYSVMCFLWIQNTNYYIFYTICANVTAITYFLEDTEYMPESPLLNAFKRTFTTTFGATCFAGALTALFEALENLFKKTIKHLPCHGCCCCCCIIECCVNLCIKFIGDLSKYGLFYSTVYNIPYHEGCRRFTEIKLKKFIDVFFGQLILDKSIFWNSFFIFVFAFVSIFFAGMDHYDFIIEYNKGSNEAYVIATSVLVVYFVLCILLENLLNEVVLTPINTISFVTMLCFSEFPDRLKTTNNNLYNEFTCQYSAATDKASKNESNS